jgi:hypothetical protein
MSNNLNILFKGNKSVSITSSIKDNNNNIYIVGTTDGATTQAEVSFIQIGEIKYTRNTYTTSGFVVKINNNNNVIWFKWIDGLLGQYVKSISIDKNYNNIYLAGYAKSNINIDNIEYPSNRSVAGFITKISKDGILSWLKWIDGAKIDGILSCVTDSSNNIILTGISQSDTINSLPLITSSTNTSSSNTSSSNTSSDSTSSRNISSTSTSSRNISSTSTSPPESIQKAFILKLDESGNYIWFKWINGDKDSDINSVVVDSLDNIYITGETQAYTINIDTNTFNRQNYNITIYFTKIKPNGTVEWFKWISGNIYDFSPILVCDIYDYIYLYANSNSPTIIINTSGYSRKTKDMKVSLPFVVKFVNDTVSWFKWIDGAAHILSTSLQIDKQNHLYLTGYTSCPTIEINDVKINNVSKNDNAYLLKIKYNGDLEWCSWIYNLDNVDNKVSKINIVNTLIDNDYNIYFNIVTNSNNIYFNNDKILSTTNRINNYGLVFKYNIKDILHEKPVIYEYIINNPFYMNAFFGLLIFFIIYVLLK